ncbi:PH domain-containing protein [Staphylococcus aureus]|uniref:PH domain-containing protein n=1 Tax=Staphylococcus aureus TaxID=1280 RepID=UPI0030F48C40
MPKYKQKYWRYDVDEHCIQLKYGGIIRKNHKVIPMNKVYYVNTVQHFILRRFNLTTVKIGTLANTHEIPAIDSKEAENIKELIVQLSQKT